MPMKAQTNALIRCVQRHFVPVEILSARPRIKQAITRSRSTKKISIHMPPCAIK